MYCKVDFPDLGMYINSITVRPSQNYDGLWVQVPKFKIFTTWIAPLEFSKSSPLWDLMHDAVLRAVDAYAHEKLDVTVPDNADPIEAIKAIWPDAEVITPNKPSI